MSSLGGVAIGKGIVLLPLVAGELDDAGFINKVFKLLLPAVCCCETTGCDLGGGGCRCCLTDAAA